MLSNLPKVTHDQEGGGHGLLMWYPAPESARLTTSQAAQPMSVWEGPVLGVLSFQ